MASCSEHSTAPSCWVLFPCIVVLTLIWASANCATPNVASRSAASATHQRPRARLVPQPSIRREGLRKLLKVAAGRNWLTLMARSWVSNRWEMVKIGKARREQRWYNLCQFSVPAPRGDESYFVCATNVLKPALKISQNFSKRSYAERSQPLLRVRRVQSGRAK